MKKPLKKRFKDFFIILPFALVFGGVGLLLHPMTDLEKEMSSEEAKYLLDLGIPEDVLRNSQTIGHYKTDYEIFPLAMESSLKMDFEKLKTMSRKGKGEDLKMVILDQDNMDLLSEKNFMLSTSGMGWGVNFFIGDKGNQDLNPHVTLTPKAISDELLHTTFRTRLSMLFKYPVSLGGGY